MIFRYFSAVLLFLLCSTELKSYISEPRKGRSQQAASFLIVLSLWFPLTLLKWVFPLVPVFWLFWWEVAAMPPGAQCQQPWQPTLGLPPWTKLPSDFTKTERLGGEIFSKNCNFQSPFYCKARYTASQNHYSNVAYVLLQILGRTLSSDFQNKRDFA